MHITTLFSLAQRTQTATSLRRLRGWTGSRDGGGDSKDYRVTFDNYLGGYSLQWTEMR